MTKTREEAIEQVVLCRNCDLHKQCRSPVPMTRPVVLRTRSTSTTTASASPSEGKEGRRQVGTAPPEFIVLGEAPGASEDRRGVPFVGKTGGFLRSRIRIMGRLQQATFMNTVCCYPRDEPDQKPTADSILACRVNLKAQLEAVPSPWVLAVGNYALKAMLRHAETMKGSMGKVIPVHGKLVFPIYHPSFILRANDVNLLQKWESELERFLYLTTTPPELAMETAGSPECYYCDDLHYPNSPVCWNHRNDWRLDQAWDPPGRRRRKGVPGQQDLFSGT